VLKEDGLKQEWEQCNKKIQELDMLEKYLADLEKETADIAQETANLAARRDTLNQQLKDLRERYMALKEAEADCPVCGRTLDAGHKERLLKDVTKEGKEVRQGIKEIEKATEDLAKQRKKIEAELKDIRLKLKERGRLEGQAALLARQLEECREAKKKIDELNEQVVPLRKQFEQKTYNEDLISRLRELEQKVSEIGYDAELHRNVQEQVKQLNRVPSEWETLQKAKAGMVSGSESLKRITRLIDERKKYLEDINRIKQDLQDAIKDLPDIMQKISELERDMQCIHREIRQLEAQRGALGERMEKIREAGKLRKQKRKEQEELNKQLELYNTLALIYGKRGIQAAIIENAIPELQDEANRILAKITDGRLAVEFLTQRDTKSGNVMETLDIKISDGMDTRKYETYSGGEEFRINFAIRIALAKILANRAGANMRMLILDEGFGVLDEQGRERLVEVINAIRDEFDKILVITHVRELKDSFPVQIEVVKTPSGSTFEIVG
jgi:exonuclease SbcC